MISRLFGRERHLSDAELSGYADGGLDARSARRAEAHLDACDAACAARLEEMRTTIAILQSVVTAKAPRSFAIDPATVADHPERPSPRVEWLRSPVFAPALAASVAAVFFAVVLVANLTGTISQSSRAVEQATVTQSAAAGAVEIEQVPAADGSGAMSTVVVEAEVVVETVVVAKVVVEAEAAVEAPEPAAASAAAPSEAPSEAMALEAAAPPMEAAVADAEEVPPAIKATVVATDEGTPPIETAVEEPGVASRAASQTPLPLPSPRPVPAGEVEAPALGQPAAVGFVGDEGRRLPVWQLELASGLAALALAGAAAALFMRRRRQ